MEIMTEGKLKGCVAALGTFDGVHLGHRAVIRTAVQKARELGVPAAVYTFRVPPRTLLGDKRVGLLTPPREKAALIGALGADIYYEEPLTPEFLSLSPEAFIRSVLLERLGVCYVVAGYNYRFGKDGMGDPALLALCGERMGFGFCSVPAVTRDGKEVSSTAIRMALERGDVEEAARLLGRHYAVTGCVERGRQVGRTLGFPTMNLTLPAELPAICRGVYAGETILRGAHYPAMINIGIRPTFGLTTLLLEAHLPGFSDEAYGETVSVSLHRFLRPEQAFSSPEALVEQMQKDRKKVIDITGEI